MCFIFFFFNDTATTEIYTLSLHDALPIYLFRWCRDAILEAHVADHVFNHHHRAIDQDRKSTRLNSSHQIISYAVFCLKKKKTLPPHRNNTHHQPSNQQETSDHELWLISQQ